jgi:hypothetical protein
MTPVQPARLTIVSSAPEPPAPRRQDRNDVDVRREDLGFMLACSLRYAIPRQSYAPAAIAGMVRAYWRHLTPRWKLVLKRDLERCLDDPDPDAIPDREVWANLQSWIEDLDVRTARRTRSRRARRAVTT